MKYCPYCGASLVGGAASFCAECGKVLPSPAKPSTPVRETQTRSTTERKPPPVGKTPSAAGRNPARVTPPPGKKVSKAQHPFPARPLSKSPEPIRRSKPDPRDEGYDGYYNDVKPIDNGHTRDQMDPELVKRVIIVAAGAFIIVIFSVILMYLL